MVHHILSGKRHGKKEDQKSIYDLIEEDMSEEELANLDPRKVKYEWWHKGSTEHDISTTNFVAGYQAGQHDTVSSATS